MSERMFLLRTPHEVRSLSHGYPRTSQALRSILHRIKTGTHPSAEDARTPEAEVPCLEAAIEAYESLKQKSDGSFTFWRDLMPCVWSWVCEEEILGGMSPAVSSGGAAGCWDGALGLVTKPGDRVEVSRKTCRAILANAFLLNLREADEDDTAGISEGAASSPAPPRFGQLSFEATYILPRSSNGFPVGFHRLLCFLAYLDLAASFDAQQLEESVVIERYGPAAPQPAVSLSASALAFLSSPSTARASIGPAGGWGKVDAPVDVDAVRVTQAAMEEPHAHCFVDFANRQIHIGRILGSLATQEEILFSCCPELYITLLNVSCMSDTEVVIIRNVRRVSAYTGYLSTFTFSGFYKGSQLVTDVLALDATMSDHFNTSQIDRDMNKAYLGFKHAAHPHVVTTTQTQTQTDPSPPAETDAANGAPSLPSKAVIVTGRWGCGVFGGDKAFKFIQQLCAATAASNVTLEYSTFHDAHTEKLFGELLSLMREHKVTVAEAYRWMCSFKGSLSRQPQANFADYFKHMIVRTKGQKSCGCV
ncbi:unnamed protein product [Vitrella brassicaformis CCMP3155]|uniref:PARG catalytic Macro domain-containing protein n=2 Tax=Vitrella brassicaformis TaxID=1169539 RepID=A0A0G4F7F2_VITBC|nr:unnamed protein product [Vitrella brassicaformis CCMP3155]|mmetsp:Transcript_17350/g.41719  ORF Transcript_17350/g.41719 Transcript_17350/m.41719 type:complete len:533 (+) Transcript_17350:75-1673(+)|eukprot:CEM08221.1 unnamed protein product [Vitrella brassicaformis CCMP3155]